MSAEIIAKIADVIRKEKKFVLLSHESPDGDSIGCQFAMAAALKKLGKDVSVVCDSVPAKYRFLPGSGDSVKCAGGKMGDWIAIFFDTPVLERSFNGKSSHFKNIINIDHHVSNTRYGDINWVDSRASSAGEMVFFLAKELGVEVGNDVATCLYVAILTDTGMFQYANTTKRTHAVVGELLESGIDQFRIYQNVYENAPLAKLKLLSESLRTIKVDGGGKLVYMWITQEMCKKTGATLELSEDIINFARSVEGSVVAVVFKETKEKGVYKVSFRSKSKKVDVNKIAANFGGGGHMAASGCTIKGKKEEVQKKILTAVKKALA